MEWIVDVASLRPARMLPREAIRDHIPKVVRTVANSLRDPIRSHGRLRRDQGYDIEELLKEYRGLADIVNSRVLEALESYPHGAHAMDTAKVFVRLASALTTIGNRTVGVYRETEIDQKRELHRHLEDYVRTISHELKQPLHAMVAGLEMLSKDDGSTDADRRQRYLGIIRKGVDRASELIGEIRRLALTEGAQQREEWQLLESAVTAVLDDMREPALKRGVRIEVERPLPRVKVDGTRFQIALANLISNAIKYSDPGKPERWVRITLERTEPDEANRWQIQVIDNGLGIPPALQPQIFQRHFRAHPGMEEGTGLGLAISRQLLEQTGGQISFESTEGEGSSFEIVVAGYLDEATSSADP